MRSHGVALPGPAAAQNTRLASRPRHGPAAPCFTAAAGVPTNSWSCAAVAALAEPAPAVVVLARLPPHLSAGVPLGGASAAGLPQHAFPILNAAATQHAFHMCISHEPVSRRLGCPIIAPAGTDRRPFVQSHAIESRTRRARRETPRYYIQSQQQ
jgi:hypothetical protein